MGYMRAELDGYADADDEVDEGDGVEGDVGQSHDADDVGHYHGYCDCEDEGCGDAAEEDRREEEDYGEGGADEGSREAYYTRVLVEEDVEFGVGEYFDVLVVGYCVCYAARGSIGSDEVRLAAQWGVRGAEVGGWY